MKKVLSIFAISLGLFALASCGETSNPEENNNNNNQPQEENNNPEENNNDTPSPEPEIVYYDYAGNYVDGNLKGEYNLCNSIQDSAILHCWNWSYNTIKANLETIAASGYSAIQTSPVQQSKSSAKGGAWRAEWSKLYQPVSFSIAADSYLGTKQELVELCEEADKYGIRVIVDVVLNHMGNDSTGHGYAEAIETYSPDVWANKDTYFHQENSSSIDYSNAYQITHYKLSELPDLNTGNETIQGYALDLLKECIDCGVDGFRFDAAKHIETDKDDAQTKSDFWKNVIGGATQYCQDNNLAVPYYYGEILDNPGGGRPYTNYTQYMAVTDTQYSDKVYALASNSLARDAITYKVQSDGLKSVVWAESHDTYANTDGKTRNTKQERINRVYAIEMSQAGAAGLYFARPTADSAMGQVGSKDWKSDEIKAVNKFHNAHLKDASKTSVQNKFYLCEKGTQSAMIVSLDSIGSKKAFKVKCAKLADGKYYDQVTGVEYTCTNGVIEGEITKTGIIVLEKTAPVLSPQITLDKETGYFYSTMNVTVTLKNVTEASYSINGQTPVTITSSSANVELSSSDSTVVLTVTAKNGSVVNTESFVYHKVEKIAGKVAIGGLKDTENLDYYAWVWYQGNTTSGHLEEIQIVGDVAYINTDRGDSYLIVCYAKGTDMSSYLSGGGNDWDNKIGQTDDFTMDENVINVSSI